MNLWKIKIIVLLIICLLFIPNLVFATWWNQSYTYKQPINISNTAGNLTNYQIDFYFNISNIGTNWNWSNNGSDVRFTNNLDNSLDYWIESWKSTVNTSTIWVNVTFLENNTNTSIYMYYGNNEVSSESNGTNTFGLFDDFEDDSIDINIWDVIVGTPTESGGIIEFDGAEEGVTSDKIFNGNYMVMGNISLEKVASANTIWGWNDVSGNKGSFYYSLSGNDFRHYYGEGSWLYTNLAVGDGGWHNIKLSMTSAQHKLWYDDILKSSPTSNLPTGDQKVKMYSSSVAYLKIDWIAVGKYASPEPTYIIGAEETASVGPTFTVTSNSPANQTQTNDNTTDFSFTVSGSEVSYNCTLYLNDTNKGTNTTTANNTATTITSSELSEGFYEWYVNCTASSVTNQSEVREITINLNYTPSTTTLYLDELSSDRYYELGTICELKANVTNPSGNLIYNATGNNICLNIDQVDYGDNYICGNGIVSYNLTTNAVKNSFNDSSTSKNLTYTNATENKTFYLNFNKYDDIQSAYIDLDGFENTSYPLNVKIYVNDTLTVELLGTINGTYGIISKLNNSESPVNLTFDNSKNILRYLSIPKGVTINNISFTLNGYLYGEFNYTNQYNSLSHYPPSVAGISYYGDYFYISDYGVNDGVHIYSYPNLVYQDTIYNIYQYGVDTNGTYIWGSHLVSAKIRKYHMNGSYISEFSTSPCVGPSGITTNNTYIWVVDNTANNGTVYKFYMNGTYANDYFDTNVVDSPVDAIGITTDSNYIWVVDALADKINKFHMNGTYTGNSFSFDYSDLMDLENDDDYFWLVKKSGIVYKHWQENYPKNVSFDIGNDNIIDGEYTGLLNSTQTVYLNITSLQNYIDSSSCEVPYCEVPLVIKSDSVGILEFADININYSYNPIDINATEINNYLSYQSSGFHNVPIKISSENNTIIQIDNINITYFGSDNISVTAHFDGDGTYSASNDTQIISVVYSDFEISLPDNYPSDELVWMPNNLTQSGVAPWGQEDSVPGYNLTALFYHGLNVNVSLKLNESLNSCINLTISNTSSKSDGKIINITFQDYIINWSGILTNRGLWFTLDLDNCSRDNYAYFNPYWHIQSCCSECICN